jgi:1,4-dihydroxy-2-naphthoyl-CoA hydrolase
MSIWKKPLDLEIMKELTKNTMIEFLGIEFIEFGEDFLKAQMPVDNRTRQPIGIMHGGASCVLAESIGSMAANLCVDNESYCVGLDINTNHIRSISSGLVQGTAKPYHIGKTTQVWGINITDENQKLISVTRLTLAVLAKKGI